MRKGPCWRGAKPNSVLSDWNVLPDLLLEVPKERGTVKGQPWRFSHAKEPWARELSTWGKTPRAGDSGRGHSVHLSPDTVFLTSSDPPGLFCPVLRVVCGATSQDRCAEKVEETAPWGDPLLCFLAEARVMFGMDREQSSQRPAPLYELEKKPPLKIL